MNAQLIEKIEAIVTTEKYKCDAFFLCGSPTSMPNDRLLAAGENYLNAVASGSVTEDIRLALINELESATKKESVAPVVSDEPADIININDILGCRDDL